jgi:hypothetical protein
LHGSAKWQKGFNACLHGSTYTHTKRQNRLKSVYMILQKDKKGLKPIYTVLDTKWHNACLHCSTKWQKVLFTRFHKMTERLKACLQEQWKLVSRCVAM